MHDLLESLPQAVVTLDCDGKVRQWNRAAENMFGWRSEEVLGCPCPFSLDDITAITDNHVLHLQCEDHRRISVRARKAPVHRAGEETGQIIWTFEEICPQGQKLPNVLPGHAQCFLTLFDSAPDAIFLHTPDGVFLNGNSAAEEMIGYRREELIGKNFFAIDLISPEFKHQVANQLERILTGEATGPDEMILIHRNGAPVFIEAHSRLIEIGGQAQILGIARDISKRKKIENQLKEKTDLLKATLESLDEAVFVINPPNRTIISASPAVKKVFGYSPLEVIGRNTAFLHPRQQAYEDWSRLGDPRLEEKGSFQSEWQMRRKDGTLFWAEIRVKAIHPGQGWTQGVVTFVRDISERKRAENALRESEKRFRDVISNAPVVLFSIDRQGIFTFSQGKGLERTGLSNDQLIGQSVYELYGDVPFNLKDNIRICGQESFECALQGKHLNGLAVIGEVSFDTFLFPQRNDHGDIIMVHGLSVDVTERRRAEEALRESEQKYRHISAEFQGLLDAIPDSLSLLTSDLKIIWANRSGLDGKKMEDCTEISCHDLIFDSSAPCPDCPVQKAFASGEPENATLPTPDGRIWGIKAFPLKSEDGTVISVIKWASDITERLLLQEEASRASRLASLGEMVAGVAHEINNPNALILLNAPILADTWPGLAQILDRYMETEGDFRTGRLPYSRLREMIPSLHQEILEGAQRIRRIVEDLKDFVRQEDGEEFRPLNLTEVAQAALRLIANPLRKATNRLEVEFDRELPPVHGHFQRLEQVVINLLLNACQALPDPDRRIRIATAHDQEKKQARLTVEDEGRGIPPEHMERLTDPFFTRRESGGTGLGLSVSARIVRSHGGKLSFRSVPDQGTTVTLELPTEF